MVQTLGLSLWSISLLAQRHYPRFIIFTPWIMMTGWWFEPLWKILVNWDDYSQYMGKLKMATKPPTRWWFSLIFPLKTWVNPAILWVNRHALLFRVDTRPARPASAATLATLQPLGLGGDRRGPLRIPRRSVDSYGKIPGFIMEYHALMEIVPMINGSWWWLMEISCKVAVAPQFRIAKLVQSSLGEFYGLW